MTPFEYVIVLISIVLGLGLTQLLSGVADLIHHWQRVKLYWPHIVWIVLAFFLHVQQWWELYGLRHVASWYLPIFLITILYPVNLYILSRILFPTIPDAPGDIDLKTFYYKHYRKFFALVIVLSLTSAVDDIVLNGFDISLIAVEVILAITLGAIAVLNISREWVHQLLVTLLLVFVLGYLGTEWKNLSLT